MPQRPLWKFAASFADGSDVSGKSSIIVPQTDPHRHSNVANGPRVLFVVGDLFRGGTATHLKMVSLGLRERGFRPEFFLLSGGGELADVIRSAGIQVHEPVYRLSPKPSLPKRAFRLCMVIVQFWVFLLRHRFDVVHFYLPENYALGAPIALLSLSRRLVMSRRSLNGYQKKFHILGRIERLLHRCGIPALGNSRRVVSQLHEEGVPKERLGLIYNGVDLNPSHSQQPFRRELGIEEKSLVLSIVANLIPYKGHVDLLEALNLVEGDLPTGWRLLVIGRDDGIGKQLQQMVARMGLADNILFLGACDDVASLFAASDIGILASHEEGFSNALIEGMASGLPMIATDVGGNAEAVLHDFNGLIVPPKDPTALASAIRRLAMDKEERISMGAAGRSRAQELFSADRCIGQYENFYRAYLDGVKVGEIPGIRAYD